MYLNNIQLEEQLKLTTNDITKQSNITIYIINEINHKTISFLILWLNCLCGKTMEFRSTTSGGIVTLQPTIEVSMSKFR